MVRKRKVWYKRLHNEKIGIVTLYHENYNFGGLLQAYALPVALEKYLNMPAEQMDYVFRPEMTNPVSDTNHRMPLAMKVYYFFVRLYVNFEKRSLQKRQNAFEHFINDIPHNKQSYECDSIEDSLQEYTSFICGGDQIWNDWRQITWYRKEDVDVFTLQFVPENIKKISYAPSMATLRLTDEHIAQLGQAINRLDAISLREKRALPLLQPLTDKKIEVVVDPVLLLEENDWLNTMRVPPIKQKYILCYLLGDSVPQRKASKAFASNTKCQIRTFPHILCNVVRKCDLFFGEIRDYTSGPREFLGLIKNAECVITDSFHACVFSMIFQTPFVVLERDKADTKGNMNSRIYDFLEEYHLENQLVTEQELAVMSEMPKVDFTYAQDHWKTRREESFAYLEHALKDNQPE